MENLFLILTNFISSLTLQDLLFPFYEARLWFAAGLKLVGMGMCILCGVYYCCHKLFVTKKSEGRYGKTY